MHAVRVDDRHEQAMVGRVRVAVVGRVVQERVPVPQLGVQRRHRGAHHVRPAHDVDRQAVGGHHELVARRHDAAGEVARGVQDARAAGPEERVRHPPHGRAQAVGEQRQLDRIAGDLGGHRAAHGSIARLPSAVRRAVAPGPTTIVVYGDSTIAGPATSSSVADVVEVRHPGVLPAIAGEVRRTRRAPGAAPPPPDARRIGRSSRIRERAWARQPTSSTCGIAVGDREQPLVQRCGSPRGRRQRRRRRRSAVRAGRPRSPRPGSGSAPRRGTRRRPRRRRRARRTPGSGLRARAATALTPSALKRSVEVTKAIAKSAEMSDSSAPAALSAAPTAGITTRRAARAARAMSTQFEPGRATAADQHRAARVDRPGRRSHPRSRATMFAWRSRAIAAAPRPRSSSRAARRRARRSPRPPRRRRGDIEPPRKYSGSMWPSTRLASVTVGSVPPRP